MNNTIIIVIVIAVTAATVRRPGVGVRGGGRRAAGGSGGDVGGCCGACPVSRRRDRRAPRPPGRARGLSTSAGGTERCATHVSLSVRTTTGSRIADVAPSRTALPAGIRSSASQSTPLHRLLIGYYYFILFRSRIGSRECPFDSVVVDSFAGYIRSRRALRYDRRGLRRPEGKGPFHRYRVTVNDIPAPCPPTQTHHYGTEGKRSIKN
ncbi:hypothetical protein ACI65C_000706 [Semiaphis heraclei]